MVKSPVSGLEADQAPFVKKPPLSASSRAHVLAVLVVSNPKQAAKSSKQTTKVRSV